MITAPEALERLQEGNRRFVAGAPSRSMRTPEERRRLTAGQEPFAVILGCSDSRVPAEIVFDQGLGDLFVTRVAGNIAAPSQVGSVEYAAAHLGSRLVVVLGHTGCGAIQATLDELRAPSSGLSPSLRSIVERIGPAVAPLLEDDEDPDDLARLAVGANIRATAAHLRDGSDVLAGLVRTDGLRIVGAEYSLETGVVTFLDGPGDDD